MLYFRRKRIIKYTRLLCQDVFSCFLSPDYLNNYYTFETKIHKQKRQWLKAKVSFEKYSISNQLDELFSLILNMAQLRHRVTDYAEFIVCEREMQALAHTFDQVFLSILSPEKFSLALRNLEEKIEDFIAIYQQILTVSAKDYFVYFIFITSLDLIYKNIIIFQEKFSDIKRI
jgi:hypothetical protein